MRNTIAVPNTSNSSIFNFPTITLTPASNSYLGFAKYLQDVATTDVLVAFKTRLVREANASRSA